MEKTKRVYNTPEIKKTQVDSELSLIMMSQPPVGPEETVESLIWGQTGWTSKVFKIMIGR